VRPLDRTPQYHHNDRWSPRSPATDASTGAAANQGDTMTIRIAVLAALIGASAMVQADLANAATSTGATKSTTSTKHTLKSRNPHHYPCQDYDPVKKTCGRHQNQEPAFLR
jgi:hypothetical protein